MRLNVMLAITDQQKSKYKKMVADYVSFFKNKQGAFQGEKRTYIPKEDTIDEPTKRGNILVTTTVGEKLKYFIEESKLFIDTLFSQEKTNSAGFAVAELFVAGKSWGTFTSLELLRLKTLLESSEFGSIEEMITSIPTKSDNEQWFPYKFDEYSTRDGIYSSPLNTGVAKTTIKTNYILEDPNLKHLKDTGAYTPQVAVKTEVMDLGEYTHQKFTGASSQEERAAMLKRRGDLLTGVIQALKESNEAEAIKSSLTADRIFGYIFQGE
jgi:hypothetical protein